MMHDKVLNVHLFDTIEAAKDHAAAKHSESIDCSILGDYVIVSPCGTIEIVRALKVFRVVEDFTPLARRADTSPDWTIYNAPRPFPASANRSWNGRFLHGVFYGSISSDDPQRRWMEERLRQLDVTRLVFISRKEVMDWARTYYRQYDIDLDNFDYKDIVHGFLNHHEDATYYG